MSTVRKLLALVLMLSILITVGLGVVWHRQHYLYIDGVLYSRDIQTLDLRGQNGDEAVMELERFIDNGVRLHLETIRIIHGKGTGVLRQRVQTCLKKHPQVKSFRLGVYGEGEDGVTIATLKK